MALSLEEVRRIAELAKLDLSDDEVALYAGQLSHILDYFQKLQQIDTSHVPPTASVLPLTNVLREDVALPPLLPQEVTANAAHAVEDQFLVEDVFGEE